MAVPAHIANAAQNPTVVPSDGDLLRARRAATELFRVTEEIGALEEELSRKKARLQELQMRELPAIFAEIGTDKIGLPDAGGDVVLAPYCHANIASDWEPERREKAFSWLESNGHGDIIKTTVSVEFSRGEHDLACQLEELIRTTFPSANSHPVNRIMGVPWNTLTALVREQITKGEVLPLDTLGATVGSVAKFKKRK